MVRQTEASWTENTHREVEWDQGSWFLLSEPLTQICSEPHTVTLSGTHSTTLLPIRIELAALCDECYTQGLLLAVQESANDAGSSYDIASATKPGFPPLKGIHD